MKELLQWCVRLAQTVSKMEPSRLNCLVCLVALIGMASVSLAALAR